MAGQVPIHQGSKDINRIPSRGLRNLRCCREQRRRDLRGPHLRVPSKVLQTGVFIIKVVWCVCWRVDDHKRRGGTLENETTTLCPTPDTSKAARYLLLDARTMIDVDPEPRLSNATFAHLAHAFQSSKRKRRGNTNGDSRSGSARYCCAVPVHSGSPMRLHCEASRARRTAEHMLARYTMMTVQPDHPPLL